MVIKTALAASALLSTAAAPIAAPLSWGDQVTVRFAGLAAEFGGEEKFFELVEDKSCGRVVCTGLELEIRDQDKVRLRLRA
jgi:hypothetical protein